MSAADPLEALRLVADDKVYGPVATAAITAWEKEREHGFGRSLEATTSIARRHEALRAEVLKVVEEIEKQHADKPLKPGEVLLRVRDTAMVVSKAEILALAARLRKACE